MLGTSEYETMEFGDVRYGEVDGNIHAQYFLMRTFGCYFFNSSTT